MLLGSFISQETIEALPDAVGIYRIDGVLMADNAAFRRFWKLPPDHMLIGNLCLLTAPGVHPDHVAALLRAREGEVVTTPAVEIDLRADPAFAEVQNKQLWMENIFAPLRDPAGIVRYVLLIFRDRTTDIRNQLRRKEAEQLLEVQRETIDALRSAQDRIRLQQDMIRELSTPIIEIWPGILTLPIMGHVDEQRAAEMSQRLLASVSSLRARHVILDLTGVEKLDQVTADRLLRILRAVPLLGARTMIAGIHPGVAQTIVQLGLDMDSIRTVRNLRSALAELIESGTG